MRRPALLTLAIALVPVAAVAVACSSSSGSGDCDGTLVVGVQAEPHISGVVASYRVTTTTDGTVARTLYSVTNPDPLFPHELRLTGKTRADVQIDAYATPGVAADPSPSDPAPVLTRIASAPFACGQTKLVRLQLEEHCLVSGFAGAFGPTCTAPQSCIGGRCADGTLSATDLEPYTSGWAEDAPDACKPPGAGPAEVVLGTGQTDFAPLPPGPIQPEKGPQGGHHLWIAIRTKNLAQSGSTTTITGVQPDTGLAAPVSAFLFTLDRDDGGYCKLYGLRYQLDSSQPIASFLGHPLDVTVEVKDKEGASAKATAHLDIATDVFVPSGL
jgi:hypothetical protein